MCSERYVCIDPYRCRIVGVQLIFNVIDCRWSQVQIPAEDTGTQYAQDGLGLKFVGRGIKQSQNRISERMVKHRTGRGNINRYPLIREFRCNLGLI